MSDEPKKVDYFTAPHPFTKWIQGYRNDVGIRARRRFYDDFIAKTNPAATDRILDVGVTPSEEFTNSNFFEEYYPHKENIVATSFEDASFLETKYPGLKFVQADGCALPFADKSFDVAVSFATIEHVGTRERQAQFVSELLRVAKRTFITTPNRGFPMELHTLLPFVHWLPQPQHQAILRRLGMEFWATTETLNLLAAKDLRQLYGSVPVSVYGYKLFGLTSNLLAYTLG
jgi:SAM-dependent methyltransferase